MEVDYKKLFLEVVEMYLCSRFPEDFEESFGRYLEAFEIRFVDGEPYVYVPDKKY